MNAYEKELLASPYVPTLPTVALRILDLAQQDQPDIEALASVISCDPSLSAKVVSLINSAAYGLSREIVSLREAVTYLGINPVRSVALSFSLIAALRGEREPLVGLDDVWRSSLMTALAARRLANETGGWDAEEAFLAGLLSDSGSLLMYKMVPEYPSIVRRFWEGEADLLELERAHLETDHMRLGAFLLESWNFPPALARVIGSHHDSSALEAGSAEELRARVLSAAWLCSRALCAPGFATEAATLEHHVSVLLGLSAPVVHAIAAELPDELRETAGFFEIPVNEQRGFDEILEATNRALSTISIEAEQRASAAEANADAFNDLLGNDALPLFSDRPAFEHLVDVVHRRARETRGSYGVMLLDFSELKELSGEEGATEDAVIQEACVRATGCLRSSDRAARLGRDQIGILLPGCPADALRKAGARVQSAIEAESIETPTGPLECRVGVGLAASTPHRDGLDHRTLLSLAGSAADRARTSPDRIVTGS